MPKFIRVRSKETNNEFDIDPINLNDTLVRLDDEPVVPAGEPDESWTNDQLRAFADDHQVDLTGVKNKADIVAAITNKEN